LCDGASDTITLTCEAGVPEIRVESSRPCDRVPDHPQEETIEFGRVPVGGVASRKFDIHNGGTATLSVFNMFFSQDSGVSTREAEIPPGGFQSVTITYRPTTTVPHANRQLEIKTNDADEPLKAVLLCFEPFEWPAFTRGDCNGDGNVVGVVTDAIYTLSYEFLGGPPPPARCR
jgi:hypothetical protein